MNYKVLLTALFVVLMIFAAAPMASAMVEGPEVIYIGWSTNGTSLSMGCYEREPDTVIYETVDYYTNNLSISYTYIDFFQSVDAYVIPSEVGDYLTNSSPDIVIVDGFFSDTTLDNTSDAYASNASFVAALEELRRLNPDIMFASMLSADGGSFAPDWFDYRDEYQYSHPSRFAGEFDSALEYSGATLYADWYDFDGMMGTLGWAFYNSGYVSSDGSGNGPTIKKGTFNNPYTVLYVGYTFDFGGITTSMGNDLASANHTYGVGSNLTPNTTVYYTQTYANIDYDSLFVPEISDIENATGFITSNEYDYIIFEMFFLDESWIDPSVKDSYDILYAAAYAASGHKASIFSNDGNVSFAPLSFEFRDLPDPYADPEDWNYIFNVALTNSGATAIGPNTFNDNYLKLLSWLN